MTTKLFLGLLVIVSVVMMVMASPRQLTIEQPEDHFNPFNKGTFKQQYMIDDTDYDGGSLLFFYTCGEAELDYYFNHSGGNFRAWAKTAKALVIFAEHRFYGESLPSNLSTPDRYNTLNLEQVVEDFAKLIVQTNQQYGKQFRVLTAGGSWAGEVAAYTRFRLPNLVIGALASSAPFYMMGYENTDNDLPMNYEYYRRVESVVNQTDQQCAVLTRDAYNTLAKFASQGSFATVQKALHLCEKPSAEDMPAVYDFIREAFAGLVQGNHPNDKPELSWPMILSCTKMTKYYNLIVKDAIEALVNSVLEDSYDKPSPCWDVTGNGNNNNNNNNNVTQKRLETKFNTKKTTPRLLLSHSTTEHTLSQRRLSSSSLSSCHNSNLTDQADLSWGYQMCTQTMYYQSAGKHSPLSIFPIFVDRPDEFYSNCKLRLGVNTESTWDRLAVSWPRTPQDWLRSTSNIIFSNGLWDPWGCAGVQQSLSDNLISINIPHASHHLDLNTPTKNDTAIIKEARELEFAILMEFAREGGADQQKLQYLRQKADDTFPSKDCPDNLYPNEWKFPEY